jgi:hypothetical protein
MIHRLTKSQPVREFPRWVRRQHGQSACFWELVHRRCRPNHPHMTGFKVKTDEVVTTREAGAEAVARHAIEAQVSQDAERLIGDWNERQARRMPLLFAPTTGAAFAARSCEYDASPVAPPKRPTRASSTAPPQRPVLSVPLRRNGRRARPRGGFWPMNNGSKRPCNRPRCSGDARNAADFSPLG